MPPLIIRIITAPLLFVITFVYNLFFAAVIETIDWIKHGWKQ